jgi:hypothetical protein
MQQPDTVDETSRTYKLVEAPRRWACGCGEHFGFGGIWFEGLRLLTELPAWACVLIALPSGVLVF